MKKYISKSDIMTISWRQIEGRNTILEALKANSKFIKIYLEQGLKLDEKTQSIVDQAKSRKILIEITSAKRLKAISKTQDHHQGVIAKIEGTPEKPISKLYEEIIQKKEKPFFIILAGVLYEHNLGAVLRTAEATGVHAVIVSNRTFGLTPVVCRTAVGAEEYIPLIHQNIFNVLKFFKEEDIPVIAAAEKNGKSIFRTDLKRGVAIMIGSEDEGISSPTEKYIDEYVKIPMFGKIGSLNLSVAAAICMYETVRQRKYNSEVVSC